MVLRILAAVVAVFAFTATPAHAGGPTSVLISAPPHVAAFGYEDARYDELMRLIKPATGEVSGAHNVGRFVRATWLIHDMSVWQIDVIYPDAPGGPWVLTENLLGDSGPVTPKWHQVAQPEELKQFLDNLKLSNGDFIGGPTLGDGDTVEQPTQQAEPAPQPAQVEAQAQASSNVFTGWRWIIPGVLVGAAGALLAVRLFPQRRWELID
jgi:hypothetical protein